MEDGTVKTHEKVTERLGSNLKDFLKINKTKK